MAKKLKGDFFLLSANHFKEGNVVFYGKSGWVNNLSQATVITKDKVNFYERKCKNDEDNGLIISPSFVEIDESRNILKLRDKIRINGITINI